MAEIAILGWGSLIWNTGELKIAGGWQTGGPQLPIEFSRISNDGRLTLVIDTQNGVNSPTRFVASGHVDLKSAIENLRDREGTTECNIGYVEVSGGQQRCKSGAGIWQAVRDWASQLGFDAVIWTDLSSNFQEKREQPFTIENAVAYLQSLSSEKLERAREYVQNAPKEVVTPLRSKLRHIGWVGKKETQ